MKPAPFDYVRAESLADAFGALDRHGDDARILAGGQSLMPILNMRLSSPQVLVDINHIEDLKGVSLTGEMLRIGALTRHSELVASADVAAAAPLLAMAAPHIAHPAIRNRGTFGGSLCHADPAAELPACMIAAEGRINISGPNGDRQVPAEAFFTGIFETVLEPGEILTSAEIPAISGDQRAAFQELARRQGDYAIAGLAAQATMQDGVFSDARLVFFSVADRPLVADETASALEDKAYSPDLVGALDAVLDADLADVADDLHSSAATKRHLAKVLAWRVLAELAGEAAS